MPSSEMLRRVALVRTDISEDSRSFIIRVTGIGELRTTLAITSNRPTLQKRNLFFKNAVLREEKPGEKPHGATSQKAAFFIGTAAKTSNLT
jgi:hypothetical protein